MNALDVAAILIIVVSAAAALRRGLASELLSLASVILGLVLAVLFYPRAAILFLQFHLSAPLAAFFGFLSIFLLAIVLGSLAVALVDRVIRTLHLKWLDRLLGGVFGLIRGWLIVVVIFLALTSFPVERHWVEGAKTAPFFLDSARLVVYFTPAEFREAFYRGYWRLYQLWMEPQELRPFHEHSTVKTDNPGIPRRSRG